MKKKYSIWSNIKFIAKIAGNVDKGIIPTVFVLFIMTIFISLLGIFMMSQILKAFMDGKELSEIIEVIKEYISWREKNEKIIEF